MTLIVVVGLWLLGAVIGLAARERRGYSTAEAVIGGLLLGPFAFILFWLSPFGGRKLRCPSCRAWIPHAARTCQHCGHDVPPPLPAAIFSAPPIHSDEHVIRSMVVSIVVGTVVITSAVLLLLNLLV